MDLAQAIALAHPVLAGGPGSGRHKSLIDIHDEIKHLHPARQGRHYTNAEFANLTKQLENLHAVLSKHVAKHCKTCGPIQHWYGEGNSPADALRTARTDLDNTYDSRDQRQHDADADHALQSMHEVVTHLASKHDIEASLKASFITAGPGDILFNPRKQMRAHIRAAARQISNHFDQISAAVNRGSGVKATISRDRIAKAMTQALLTATTTGFQDGAKHSGYRMSKSFGKWATASAQKRAGEVDDLMRHTTKKWLKAGNGYALTPDRAMRAAQYEVGNAYFGGLQQSFAGSGARKSWIVGSGDPCPDCQDNEDQGVIDVDDTFDSGHDTPLAHLQCQCYLAVHL